MNTQEMESIFNLAKDAGFRAARDIDVDPMYIRDGSMIHVVQDGPCGFAWVNVRGNTAFGRWLKKTGKAHKAYGGGLSIWIHEHGQSMARKAAHARAMADILRNAGISAYPGSRMD